MLLFQRRIFPALRRVALAAALAACAAPVVGAFDGFASPARAGEAELGDLAISDAWARASIGAAANSAAYFAIANNGGEDRLIAVRADVADKVALHMSERNNDVVTMKPVDGIDAPAGGVVALTPGGYHVMLMQLKAPLKDGDRFPLTLEFENAGEVTVEVDVRAMAGGDDVMEHGEMDHGEMDGGDAGDHDHGEMKAKE